MVEASEEKPTELVAENEEVLEEEVKEEEPEVKEKLENLTPEFIENLEEVFGMFDENKEEKIDTGSLCKVLNWVGFNPSNEEIREWINEFDKNRTGMISLAKVKVICNRKYVDPDSIDQTIEALKLFDNSKDGKIDVTELRWALVKLGDMMDETQVDEMIA